MTESAQEKEIDLLQSTLRAEQPHAILQIGAGSYEHTKAIVESVRELPGSQYTLLISPEDQQTIDRLKDEGFDDWTDCVKLPADQVLPDFYFQQRISNESTGL